jgi:serine/threonine-protein kinase
VGVVLFEMLTGTRAFHGADPRSVLLAVLTRNLASVRSLRPELPSTVDRIVARAVERDPRARYRNAAEFQHDLLLARTSLRRQRAARRGTNTPSPAPRAASSVRRRPLVDELELPTVQLTSRAAFRRGA